MSENLTFVRPGIYRTPDGKISPRVARIDMRSADGTSLALYAPGQEHSDALEPLTVEEAISRAWAKLTWSENLNNGFSEAIITVGDNDLTVRLLSQDKVKAYKARIDRVKSRSPEMFD